VAARTYRLIVEGELGNQLESAFGGMTLTRNEGTTTLTGDLRDQAELQGVLRRVSDLGLTLLAVSSDPRVDEGVTSGTAGQRTAVAAEAPREGS
jgi:hypothetical protein